FRRNTCADAGRVDQWPDRYSATARGSRGSLAPASKLAGSLPALHELFCDADGRRNVLPLPAIADRRGDNHAWIAAAKYGKQAGASSVVTRRSNRGCGGESGSGPFATCDRQRIMQRIIM